MTAAGELRRALLGLGLAPRSAALYLSTIQSADRYFTDAGWSLSRATPEQVAAYAATKPLTFASRSLIRIALAHYWSLTDHPAPPLRAVRCPPKPEMVCKALDDDDARRLAKTARSRRDRQGAAVILGMYQGMRREEIASTRWDAAEDDWLTVIGKGAKTRTIPLHHVADEALSWLPRSSLYVFPGQQTGHVSPASIWNWVRQVADEAGVGRVKPHWLRHTALATQNDATGDLRAVQTFAGHARSSTTEGYTRSTKAALLRVSRAIDY
ncbi:MAG: tyrosine-type recombinase/integrase [Chloroflexi bacterium]|nr:tyrosine-type recombinase/integrase [Chloroflexota bacterium]